MSVSVSPRRETRSWYSASVGSGVITVILCRCVISGLARWRIRNLGFDGQQYNGVKRLGQGAKISRFRDISCQLSASLAIYSIAVVRQMWF